MLLDSASCRAAQGPTCWCIAVRAQPMLSKWLRQQLVPCRQHETDPWSKLGPDPLTLPMWYWWARAWIQHTLIGNFRIRKISIYLDLLSKLTIQLPAFPSLILNKNSRESTTHRTYTILDTDFEGYWWSMCFTLTVLNSIEICSGQVRVLNIMDKSATATRPSRTAHLYRSIYPPAGVDTHMPIVVTEKWKTWSFKTAWRTMRKKNHAMLWFWPCENVSFWNKASISKEMLNTSSHFK
jgi:hypothetical protein